MTLEQPVFMDICKALGAVPEPEAELRRRASPRFQVDHEISVKRHGVHAAAFHSVTLLNISASGMCEGGRILHHLKNNISDSRNTVLIVGYRRGDAAFGPRGRGSPSKDPPGHR